VAENFDQLDVIEERLKITSQINRRTKAGRELTKKIEGYIGKVRYELINKGEQPFK